MAILLISSSQPHKIFNCSNVERILQNYHCVRLNETSFAIETDETPFTVREKLKHFIGYDESLVVLHLSLNSPNPIG
jgi:hypothetical protein